MLAARKSEMLPETDVDVGIDVLTGAGERCGLEVQSAPGLANPTRMVTPARMDSRPLMAAGATGMAVLDQAKAALVQAMVGHCG